MRSVTHSPPGTWTWKAASSPCTVSALTALADKVSSLKLTSLLWQAKGRRSLEKKELSEPGSHNAWMVRVSSSLIRVRELVSRLGLPKLPLLIQLWVHRATCPSSSCNGSPET